MVGHEIEALRELARRVHSKARFTFLTGTDVTYQRLLAELARGDYDLVHFSGLMAFDRHEVSLALYDGTLHVSELVTLLSRRPPALMMLNAPGAIETAFEFTRRDAYEATAPTGDVLAAEAGIGGRNFARAAARAGVGAFVGGFGMLTDVGAKCLSIAFYRGLLAGSSVGRALWMARRHVRARNADIWIDPAYYFTMSGYADLVLCDPPKLPARRPPRPGTKRPARAKQP
jgi:hypothetical protein